MKFSKIAKGTRAEREIALPARAEAPAVPFLVRPLSGAEEAAVVAGALEFARASGVADPKPGQELYDLGRMVHTLVLASLDTDSPPEAREPFFDGGIAQVLEQHVETITYLWEQQELWQGECSPYERSLSDADLMRLVSEVAQPTGQAAFIGLSPVMRWVFTHSLAKQLLGSLERKSPSTPPSSSPTSESATSTTPDAPNSSETPRPPSPGESTP